MRQLNSMQNTSTTIHGPYQTQYKPIEMDLPKISPPQTTPHYLYEQKKSYQVLNQDGTVTIINER